MLSGGNNVREKIIGVIPVHILHLLDDRHCIAVTPMVVKAVKGTLEVTKELFL